MKVSLRAICGLRITYEIVLLTKLDGVGVQALRCGSPTLEVCETTTATSHHMNILESDTMNVLVWELFIFGNLVIELHLKNLTLVGVLRCVVLVTLYPLLVSFNRIFKSIDTYTSPKVCITKLILKMNMKYLTYNQRR